MKKLAYCFMLLATISCASQPMNKVNVLSNENSEVKVTPPNCPDWSGENKLFNAQAKSSFYGCATTKNYGKMIDDPMDMLTGKSSNFYDGQTAVNAVRTNRTQAAQ